MQNNTQRKKALVNGVKGNTLPDVFRKIDLRLEAKLSAEVSLVIIQFVGVLLNKCLSLYNKTFQEFF